MNEAAKTSERPDTFHAACRDCGDAWTESAWEVNEAGELQERTVIPCPACGSRNVSVSGD